MMLCAEEMRIRYGGRIWLCGSGLTCSDPRDWDVRVILDDKIFDAREHLYWSTEAALRTREQSKLNLLNFDIRIYPQRLWYEVSAIRLDEYAPRLATHQVVPELETAESIEQAKATIAKHKDEPEFHILIGSIMFMRGDKATALQAFVRAIQLDPKIPGGWLNIGNIYYDYGEFRRAAIYYRRAIALKPDYAKAYINMANTLTQLGVHAAAIPFYERAIKLEPGLAPAFHNKANCLTHMKQFDLAEQALNRALEIEPGDEKTLNTFGNLRSNQGLEYASGAAYRLAIATNPRYAPLYTNLANIYMNLGRAQEAVVNYERGLVLEPKNPGVRYNLALAYLREGNYRLGWRAYESRWKFHDLSTKPRDFKQPQWAGEDITGKRILVWCEQGTGDSFQFCRYVPFVARRGGIVYFEVQHRLQRIMATVEGVSMICTRGLPLPDFDLHVPLMSLPAIFKTEVNTVPLNIPYVSAWKWEVVNVRKRWQQTGFRIGLSWAGNPKYKRDLVRSFSLREFAPLASIPGVTLFSLQFGPAARQIEKYADVVQVVDASSTAKSFADTAALVDTLDLVICSDSSPAHLAAAMGKRVWLLLAYLPDWRWMAEGETTPWYPNMRLFRQTSPGDWAGVMRDVKAALEERLARD